MKEINIAHLVKSEDLNHHGTLFAGRIAEWFVEACFIAACDLIKKPENIVCLKIHGLEFRKSATKGDIIKIKAKVVLTGRSSIKTYAKVYKNDEEEPILEGFATFIHVDEEGKPVPHNVVLPEPENEEEMRLREIAAQLR
ncbi:acyl-CoA thioesterase [Caldanaerobacter subterraneus]|uniref:Acyl-CoA thioesterase n=1 Tax=Caldanaerobacter subterraneus TaxID=911092 RepID=A0A7Y2PKZ3_9THEO|nr:hotdog domain-containing protein [Caldanaerobacter subterraneus]NNG67524.1 acyl-CoA thioesterase [Caldanaerobacter subterraneus]